MQKKRTYLIDFIYISSFCIIYFLWFNFLQTAGKGFEHHVIYSPIDAFIPFISYFVVPYILWFLFMPAVLVLIYVKAYAYFRRTFFMFAVGMLIALFIYTIYPSEQLLRAEIVGDNILNTLVLMFYKNDPSINVCPSIHALNSWVLAICTVRTGILNHFGNTVLMVVATAIAISTVFIKQHSIIDIFAAMVLAVILYLVFFVVGERLCQKKSIKAY